MDDTMKDDKKKKKGVAIVIAVTPHAPKKPENTMKPDGKPMKKAWAVLKENNAIETEQALGVSPKEHKRRMLAQSAIEGSREAAQGRYQRGELPRHMIDTEEQQENEQFYDEDMETDMDNLPPDEIYEMFRQD
jgi:hypothetical protein